MAERKRAFRTPITRAEKIFGIIYIFVHSLLLPQILGLVSVIAPRYGLEISENDLNLIYYMVSFIIVLIFMFRFLRKSFSDIFDGFGRFLTTAALGCVIYYAAAAAVNGALALVMPDLINPSVESEIELTKLDYDKTLVIAVLLAPLVEESIFRGALFGTIRPKSAFLAYAVTAVLFAVYHLWPYFIADFNWLDLLYLFQYIPVGLILAWCYERSGTIWTPMLVHALINLVAVKVQVTL